MLWGTSTSCENINRIRIMQKKAIRLIKNANYNDHTAPIRKELSLLSIDDVINLELAKYMYKYTYDILPCELRKFLTKSNEIHSHDTRHGNTIAIKRKFAPLDHSFLVKAPNFWNKIKRDKKEIRNMKRFLAIIKKDMIQSY